jgi:hypothetical protein
LESSINQSRCHRIHSNSSTTQIKCCTFRKHCQRSFRTTIRRSSFWWSTLPMLKRTWWRIKLFHKKFQISSK